MMRSFQSTCFCLIALLAFPSCRLASKITAREMGAEPNRSVAVDGDDIYYTDTDVLEPIGGRESCNKSLNIVAMDDDMVPQVMRSSCLLDLRASDGNLVGALCTEKCRVVLWPKGGGERVLEVEQLSGVAAGPAAAYWTDASHVWRLAYTEERSRAIASDQPEPFDLVVRAGVAYWTNYGGGSVVKVSTAGDKFVVLAQGLEHPSQIAVDDRYVYFITGYKPEVLVRTGARKHVVVRGQGTVSRVPIDGGKVEPLANGRDTPKQVAPLDGAVYFLDKGKDGVDTLMQWHASKGLRSVDAGRPVHGLTAGATDLVLSTSEGLYRIPASRLR